jgi:hypothetical protein
VTGPALTHPGDINGPKLTRTAFDILVADLEGHGNILAPMHRAALLELVETFAGYCAGQQEGRKAFPMPTGMGKTSAVVAFLAALHRLGYRVPVAVAASKVEALCSLKREMLAHGIPADLVGLKHTVTGASEPSTGNESRLFQLVTHARVRGGDDVELVGHHGGQPRPLVIYDETFMRSDAFAFRARAFFAAAAVFTGIAEGNPGPLVKQLDAYLAECQQRVRAALDQLRASGDPDRNGLPVELGKLTPGELDAFRNLASRHARDLRGFEVELCGLLELSQGTLRVLGTEQGEGIITAREVVPLALRNVVILDASVPVRGLAQLDPTVSVVDSFDAATLKSFERLEVHQLVSPGGRHSIGGHLRTDRRELSAVALEVAGIIKAGWETERAFLVFTFAKRGNLDMEAELRRDLERAGVHVDAKTSDDKPRLQFLTWGSETSLNGLEHCTSVIMAGVLHRNHLDLSAAVRGQTGNPAEPTPGPLVREIVESEIAHCIYQGASRGSCRRIDDGKAGAMRLWFIHRSPTIRSLLDRVMPGAAWSYPDPQHLAKATADSRAARLLEDLLGHLRGLPEGVEKTSSSEAKKALSVAKDGATSKAWTRAVHFLDLDSHGWTLQGRSFIRGSAAYGFHSQI